MCIGIIYDAYTNDSWCKIDKDVYSVKVALRTVRLPLPVAGIFDTNKGDFIELNADYRRYRPQLMEKVVAIFNNYNRTMAILNASSDVNAAPAVSV